MKSIPNQRQAGVRALAMLLLALWQPAVRPAAGAPVDGDARDGAPKTLWASPGRSVRLIAQDRPAPPNDHPAALSPAELRTILAAISVFGGPAFLGAGGEPISVFTEDEAHVLAQALASALAAARPDQDAAFTVEGKRDAFFFAQEPLTIGGRMFYDDQRLHIIFGDLHQPAGRPALDRHENAKTGERLYPVRIGTRAGDIAHHWRIVPTEGQSFHVEADTTRGDWIEIDVPATLAALRRRQSGVGPLPKAVDQPRSEARRFDLERRQEREETARARQSLRDIQGPADDSALLQRRLATLEELKNKRLITPEEYAERRRAMLLGR
ncbi:MAG: hypothetical protein ACREXJ_07540 [Gammaproteobacteria bacterium]